MREIQQKYKDLYEIPDYYVKYLRGQLYEEKFSIKRPNLIANVRPFLPVCVVFVLFFSVSTRLSYTHFLQFVFKVCHYEESVDVIG